MRARDELVFTMVDSEVLRVPDIHQSVIAAPAVGLNDGVNRDSTANNGLKCALFTVRDNLGINAAVTFEDAEDNGLATSSSASLSTHSASAEVTLVNFD